MRDDDNDMHVPSSSARAPATASGTPSERPLRSSIPASPTEVSVVVVAVWVCAMRRTLRGGPVSVTVCFAMTND